MEDIQLLKGSLAQMQAMFTEQMAVYEGKLQKTDAPATTSTLAADFAAFKAFVITALKALQDQIQATALAVDQLEMRNRRKFLLLHGVPEEKKEDTAAVVEKVVAGRLKMAGFTKADINRCHRMGRLTSDRPRPILIKLRDVSVRDGMWFAKTHLKDSGITLSEFLTRTRHEVFMQARQRFGINKCWTREGYVFVVGSDDTRQRVSSITELNKLSGLQAKELSSPAPAKPTAAREPAAAAASVAAAAAAAKPKRVARK